MKELFTMWGNIRMVVLTSISASLYASLLIPFKVIPIIPGVTEIRPANAIPIVCSFLFGPASAWGSAFGNVIGDFFGGMGPGTFFGFLGNFLYGFIPYKIWGTKNVPLPTTAWTWLKFLGVILLASLLCAVTIGWGLNILGFVPFSVLANIVFLNNLLMASILSPILLHLLYFRVRNLGLLYDQVMEEDFSPGRYHSIGLFLLIVASFFGLIWGNLLSLGYVRLGWIQTLGLISVTNNFQVGLGMLPIMGLFIIGIWLL